MRIATSLFATSVLLLTVFISSDGKASTAYAVTPQVTKHRLWRNKVTLQLPSSAANPKRLSTKLYSIQPKSSQQKFVIFVTRESLMRDEVKQSNKHLRNSFQKLLEAQGYQILRLKETNGTFVADFKSFVSVPWQKVGTTAVRGTANFKRSGNELVGAVLLCEPRQWADPATKDFRRVVSGAKVS